MVIKSGGREMKHVIKIKNALRSLVRKMKERYHLEELDIGGRIILN
jgi:hypothetical protein